MKAFKKLLTLIAIASTMGLSAQVNADECCYNNNEGQGFASCCSTPSLVPAIAIGAVALVAIVAVACQNNGSHGGHGHAH